MLLLLLLVNYYCTAAVNTNCDPTETPISICLSICLCMGVGGCLCVCVLQRSLVNDWTPTGRPLPRPPTVISQSHWLLPGQPSPGRPMAAAPYATSHALLLLKSPHIFNGDSIPSLTYSAWVRSHHCCSPSICLYLWFSLSLSVTLLIFILSPFFTLVSSLLLCLKVLFPLSISPLNPLFVSLSYVLLSVQHLCRLEFAGPRQELFIFCECVCVLKRGGRGDNTQEHLTNISSKYVET